ncbi:MAG: hypothetical protein GXZ08_05385 [Tissierellia bacterium]|nr:hypothetical protein [Tissierellia bacterium]
MRKIKVNIIYESLVYENLEVGQKIINPNFGEGLIVGFSEITGEPFCFFKDAYNKGEFKLICIGGESFIT